MGRVQGKVALITGAARGQGRSHAIRLAEEGADIIAVDICADIPTVTYPLATEADLAETVKLVEQFDRRALGRKADVRDLAALEAVVAEAMAEFGRIDVVVANAGYASMNPLLEVTEQQWDDTIGTLLTGVWKTVRAAVPQMVERGEGGSVILISSAAGLAGYANIGHYTAAKHGVVGLMRALSVEMAPHMIRVNSVHPTTVDTPMVQNPATYELFTGRADITREEAMSAFMPVNALPVPWVEPRDISNAVLYLASDEARYVTGTTMQVDAGANNAVKLPHNI
jgi:SDR family mycofactocin-dependent oxidoreductase